MSTTETVKVVLLGEAGVGKTCIISQFISGVFDADTISSLSAQFITKTLEYKKYEKSLKFEIWDTAGQERFRSLAKIFYKDAKVICLVYDITSKKSFEELKNFWYEQQTKLNVDGEPIFAVVGNKYDLYETTQVDDEAKNFAKSIGAIFQYTSAKEASGINELFNNIGEKYFNPSIDINEIENKEKEEYEQKKLQKAQKKVENKGKIKLNASVHQEKPKKGCC
jgi:small GTP-binding protein